ncbi:hypothetical protein [Acetanaerobacterium elongatum]|uniref:Uncharacterized protein n=1 Tax=Acetanaerobacterium elongatum TaxID=258515 RepID=A0A1G9Z5Y3_9FIRM|nr:hypothetical protein [Acetanaerobacterium elongatum]SDN16674.1 hypothetical protein SAMN05192585_112103 [Acetanaerobacterium elongatum]
MVKTYSFLSGFVLRLIIGNLLVTPLMVLAGGAGMILSPIIIMLTFFMGILWVVLKLLQAHFPEKTIEIPYTETTRHKQRIGAIVSVIVCVIVLSLNILLFADQSQPSVSVVSWGSINFQLPAMFSSLVLLPLVIIILLVNVYVAWFYRLAGQRRLPPKELSEENN